MIDSGDLEKLHILVVGDVMLDRYWFGDVERISPEAPVPIVKVDSQRERPGGAANVACNVKALGARCTLLSVVGRDDAGQRLAEALSGSGIETVMKSDPNALTTVKLRVLSRNQQLIRADFETKPGGEVLASCLEDYRGLVGQVDAVILSDYGKGGLLHIVEMIELAKQSGTPVMVDPKGSDFDRYRNVDLMTPNFRELELACGDIDNEEELAKTGIGLCQDLGLKGLLVTRSEAGMTLFRPGRVPLTSAARAKEVFDVSGAGDTVISAVTVAHCLGLDDEEILSFANAAAGVVVSKLGPATATLAEVREVLAETDDE